MPCGLLGQHMSDAVEVTLIGLRCIANGEVHLTMAVHKDDAEKMKHLMGRVGQAFGMALANINYQATGTACAPSVSADVNPTGACRNAGDSLDIPPLDQTQGGHSTTTVLNEAVLAPESSLKTAAPGNSLGRPAAIWLQRSDVQLYMHKTYCIPRNFDSAKGKTKELLGIESLREIVEGSEAHSDFSALQINFKIWMNEPRYTAG